jgi:hypothetical protein
MILAAIHLGPVPIAQKAKPKVWSLDLLRERAALAKNAGRDRTFELSLEHPMLLLANKILL